MASPLRPLRLIIFNADAATLVARSRGMFAAEGLDVNITITPNSTEQMRGLGTGTWDIASTAFDNVLAWSGREGAEIIAVAQVVDKILLPVLVRPEIRKWEDLRGRRLAVDAVDTAYALVLRRILLAHGLDLKRGDYELVPAGATEPRVESMKRGETFAAILNPPWDAKAVEAGMLRLGDHREVLPDYPGGVFAVTRAWSRSHRDELVGFLRAWIRALKWATDPANREETIDIIASDQSLNSEAAARHLGRLPKGGDLNLAGLKTALGLRVDLGLTPSMGTDLSRYCDRELYQAAQS